MYNPYLVVPFAVWLITQTLKFSLAAFRGKIDFRYFYASGGMPSVHSAVVCSLAVTALLVDGSQSSIFGLTALFAAIVMYDSFGVRRSSGEQAAALNMLIESLEKDKVRLREPSLKLREILGHKPLEVVVGAILGVLLGCLFNIYRLQPQLDFLASRPVRLEMMIYGAIFGLLVVGGVATRIFLARRYPKSPSIKTFAKHLFYKTQIIGWLGVLLTITQYEKLAYFNWRAWSWLLLVALVIWDSYLVAHFYKSLPQALAEEAEAERRSKWLPSRRKKRK